MADIPKCPALSPRLRMTAELVRPGARAADVGTDHALLPVWLVKTGRSPRCVACDVREGPLRSAAETLRRFSAQEQVELRLSDGLAAVGEDEADDVVIAGMGGELIARIVEDCPWLRDGGKRLVLQPMTAQPELRAALCRLGFTIEREAASREGRRLYMAMTARFADVVRQPDALFLHAGLLGENGDPCSAAFLAREASALMKKACGQRRSGRLDAEAARCEALAARLAALSQRGGSTAGTT